MRRKLEFSRTDPVAFKALPVEPRQGDIRRIKKFLWWWKTLPNQQGERVWRWLETAEIEQVYEAVGRRKTRIGFRVTRFGWVAKKWLDAL